jgi:hypothetical protein
VRQRRERDRAPQQRVVEHRHLDHHAAQPLRGERGALQRGVGAQRRAEHDRLVDLHVVEQRDHLGAERRHRVAPHVGRPVGLPVPEQVDRDDAVPPVGERLRQLGVHPLAEQQAVDEHGHPRPLAVAGVRQPVAVEHERVLGDVRHAAGV